MMIFSNRRVLGSQVIALLLLFLFSVESVAQQKSDARGLDVGPIPKDQRKAAEREKALVSPLPIRDAKEYEKTGRRIGAIGPRIVGGLPAPKAAYPWMVSLVLRNRPASIGHFCGGSLVASRWVITAAHCVDGNTKADDIEIVFGSNDLSVAKGRVSVKEIFVHKKWNKWSFRYDVALLELKKDVPNAKVIKLITPELEGKILPVGTLSTVAGWGLTDENGKISTILRHVGVKIVSYETCTSAAAYSEADVTDEMFCAGFIVGGKDSCKGDSGGPNMVFDGAGGLLLAGIVSWGDGCARAGKFGVYTRLTNKGVYDWVKANLPQQ